MGRAGAVAVAVVGTAVVVVAVVVVVVVVVEVGVASFTRTVGLENVNPDALIVRLSPVTFTFVVAVLVTPPVPSITSTVNCDADLMDVPHRQVAVSRGIIAS